MVAAEQFLCVFLHWELMSATLPPLVSYIIFALNIRRKHLMSWE